MLASSHSAARCSALRSAPHSRTAPKSRATIPPPPTSRRRRPTRRRPPPASRPKSSSRAPARPAGRSRHRHGALHRLDDRRQDVRQLGLARQAGDVPARPRHRRLDRRRAADGRRREAPLLDSRSARLQGPARAEGHARVRRRADLDHRRRQRAGRREGARPPTRRRRRAASPTKCCKPGPARRIPSASSTGHGPLHGLDDRRQDVRQLGRARPAGRRFRSTA